MAPAVRSPPRWRLILRGGNPSWIPRKPRNRMSRKRFDMGWRLATDTAQRIIFISLNGDGTPMFARTISPVTLCVTGFGWLALASILGMASIVGLVYGTPLPAWWGMLHVHAVLIGGVTQIILGGFLLLIPPL